MDESLVRVVRGGRGSSVRFQQASDPSHFESCDFETNQYFMAAAKDGRTLLRALSASGFRGSGGGRLDLIRPA
ncbi:hypothetical protein ACWD0A_12815 [Streptomyces sp. NPDC002867]